MNIRVQASAPDVPWVSRAEMMALARWKTSFCQRHLARRPPARTPYPDRDYSPIVQLVAQSTGDIAGGPALRLADAVWDFEWRLFLPNWKVPRETEERSFCRLKEEHDDALKARSYRVWKGIDVFEPIREKRFGGASIGLPKIDLHTRDRMVERAFYRLDQSAMSGPAYAGRILELSLELYPSASLMRGLHVLSRAVRQATICQAKPTDRTEEGRYRDARKALKRFENTSRDWIARTPFREAIELLDGSFNT